MKDYSEAVINYFQQAKHSGDFNADEVDIFRTVVGDYVLGAKVQLAVKLQQDKVVDARFKAFGCVATIAACSYLCEQLIGRNLRTSEMFQAEHLMRVLTLPEIKRPIMILLEQALLNLQNLVA